MTAAIPRPSELTSSGLDPDVLLVRSPARELASGQFRVFSRWVHDELGIQMPPSKEPMLMGRLHKRLRALGLKDVGEYQRYLAESGAAGTERQAFIDVVTTNTTSFFREPVQFERLHHLLPELCEHAVRTRGLRRVHVWSAGCSTGEEVYTLAMVLEEYCRAHPGTEYRILATDVSSRVLSIARHGVYPQAALTTVPPELRKRYFRPSRDPAQCVERVVPQLRSRISFYRLNFVDPAYPVGDEYDAVFFRNVAIYFDAPTQAAVVGRLCRHLRVGGCLFLGQSEALAGRSGPLRRIAPSFYRKI